MCLKKMTKIIALNHKMNLNYDLVNEYIERINKVKTDNKIIIIPSYLYIETFIKNTKYDIGSQNLSNELNGAFTGEISSIQLNSIGAKYSLVGHSERRNLFHETDEIINEKTRQCLNHGITPIICVGETLSEHNNDETLVKINNQISHAILGLDDLNEKKEIIIAYEPIYAIGTGKAPEVKEIEIVINHIYEVLSKYDNIDFKILYGGSVNKENIKKILDINKLDGVLIGTISSKIEDIIKIIETV